VANIDGCHQPVACGISQLCLRGDDIVDQCQPRIARDQRLEPGRSIAVHQCEVGTIDHEPTVGETPVPLGLVQIHWHGRQHHVRIRERPCDIVAEPRLQARHVEAAGRLDRTQRHFDFTCRHDAGIGKADRSRRKPDRGFAEMALQIERWRPRGYANSASARVNDCPAPCRTQRQPTLFKRKIGQFETVEPDIRARAPQGDVPTLIASVDG
jgi:hypothetical protein